MAQRESLAWTGPGERLRRAMPASPDALLAAAAELRPAASLVAAPGALRGVVLEADGRRVATEVLADVLGPWWRARWLEALGSVDARAPVYDDVEAVAAAGLDPVPPPRSLRARCGHGADAGVAWCVHATVVAEALALLLDDGRLEGLLRLRGLPEGQAPLVLAAERPDAAAQASVVPAGEDDVDDSAFWGGAGQAAAPLVEPWQEAPAAILRLGPLPAARGQAHAVEPLVAHYRRVRDAVAGLVRTEPRPRVRRHASRASDAPSQEKEA